MIFCEKTYAENLLKNGFSKFMSYNDLAILARYYRFLGKNKTQIYDDLIDFCKKHNSDFNEVLSFKKIKNAIKTTDKYSLRIGSDTNITKVEMQKILELSDYKIQKVLFIMLALSKYFKQHKTNIKEKKETKYSNNFYVNEKFTNILRMAKVNLSKAKRLEMMQFLEEAGYITTTLVGSFKINFVDIYSPIEIEILDIDNAISFFPFYCKSCGIKYIPIIRNRVGLCNTCYQEFVRNKKLMQSKIIVS